MSSVSSTEELDPGVGSAALDGEALLGRELCLVDVAADADDMIDVVVGQPDAAGLVGQGHDRLGECRRCGGEYRQGAGKPRLLPNLGTEILLLKGGQPEAAIVDREADAQVSTELADDAADDADLLDGHDDLGIGVGDRLIAADIGRDRQRRIAGELVQQPVQAVAQAIIGARIWTRLSNSWNWRSAE